MKKQILYSSILGVFFLFLFSCKKDPPDPKPTPEPYFWEYLPEITQEGKNTFGCKVNGEVWVPHFETLVPWADKTVYLKEKNGSGVGFILGNILSSTQDESMELIFGPTYFKCGIYYASGNTSTDLYLRD